MGPFLVHHYRNWFANTLHTIDWIATADVRSHCNGHHHQNCFCLVYYCSAAAINANSIIFSLLPLRLSFQGCRILFSHGAPNSCPIKCNIEGSPRPKECPFLCRRFKAFLKIPRTHPHFSRGHDSPVPCSMFMPIAPIHFLGG